MTNHEFQTRPENPCPPVNPWPLAISLSLVLWVGISLVEWIIMR